jgi:hypothetical protein
LTLSSFICKNIVFVSFLSISNSPSLSPYFSTWSVPRELYISCIRKPSQGHIWISHCCLYGVWFPIKSLCDQTDYLCNFTKLSSILLLCCRVSQPLSYSQLPWFPMG